MTTVCLLATSCLKIKLCGDSDTHDTICNPDPDPIPEIYIRRQLLRVIGKLNALVLPIMHFDYTEHKCSVCKS